MYSLSSRNDWLRQLIPRKTNMGSSSHENRFVRLRSGLRSLMNIRCIQRTPPFVIFPNHHEETKGALKEHQRKGKGAKLPLSAWLTTGVPGNHI